MTAFVPHGSGNVPSTRLVKRLRDAGATSEWSARPLETKSPIEGRMLERSLRSGVVRQTDKGTFWVDEERLARCRTKQLRFALIAVLGVLLMFGILFILGEFP
jgi:hypothetical protein